MKFKKHPYWRKGFALPPLVHDISAGRVTGHSRVSQPGHNPSIDAVWELVSAKSGAYTWLNTADTLHVMSDQGADTVLGTGARTVYIWGLNANWQEISETINMNGAVAVATTLKYLRVLGAYVVTAGTGLQNAGNISIMDITDTHTLAYIEAIKNRALAALYAVPAGYDLYLNHWYCAEAAGKETDFVFRWREYGGLFQFSRCVTIRNKGMDFHISPPKKVSARSDFSIQCYTSGGGGVGCAGFDGWIESV